MKPKDICHIAIMSAMLSAVKNVLAAVANVELVTLLLLVYTLTLGYRKTILASFIFVITEVFIWGFGSWVLIYIIYWPLLVTVLALLGRIKKHTVVFAICGAILMTVLFGVISTAIEIIFMGANTLELFLRFYKYRYLSGVAFFLTHIISNAIILPILTMPLLKLFKNFNGYHKVAQ